MAVYGLELGFDPDRVLTFTVPKRGERYRMLTDVRNFDRTSL